jgi:16S rRNA G1207 methylase RsmC
MTHYFDEVQDTPLLPEIISFQVSGRRFSCTVGGGVFSKDGLDSATKLLIEQTVLEGDESVLDLGCGWGAVGVVLKSLHPRISLVMSDVNRRAIMLAKKNIADNHLVADVRFSDVFSAIPESFDLIVTNPPFAAGRALCYSFIEESFVHLKPHGRFLLVARHQKGGAMLEKKIAEVFGNVKTLAKKSGFRVYMGEKL